VGVVHQTLIALTCDEVYGTLNLTRSVEALAPGRRSQKVDEEAGQSCCYPPALCRCPR